MADGVQQHPTDGLSATYEAKPASYFANSRSDIVDRMTTGPNSAVLELGCGAGGTGRSVLANGKARRYVGLEINPAAAAIAAEYLSEVIVGNVEELDLAGLQNQFDVLIISEVLEHLTDPWATLERLAKCLKPGGMVYASSPNISHWTVIWGLIRGRFEYEESGFWDRTHLRWFTPTSYRALFIGAGFEVLETGSVAPLRPKARLIDRLTGGRLKHLFIGQVMIVARRAAI